MTSYEDRYRQHGNIHVRIALSSLEKVEEWWREDMQIPNEVRSGLKALREKIKYFGSHYTNITSVYEELRLENLILYENSQGKTRDLVDSMLKTEELNRLRMSKAMYELKTGEEETASINNQLNEYKMKLSTAKDTQARVKRMHKLMVDRLTKSAEYQELYTSTIAEKAKESQMYEGQLKLQKEIISSLQKETDERMHEYETNTTKFINGMANLNKEGTQAVKAITIQKGVLDENKKTLKSLEAQSRMLQSNMRVARSEMEELQSRKVYFLRESLQKTSVINNEKFRVKEICKLLEETETKADAELAMLQDEETSLVDIMAVAEAKRDVAEVEAIIAEEELTTVQVQNDMNDNAVVKIQQEISALEAKLQRKMEESKELRSRLPKFYQVLCEEIEKLRKRLSEVREIGQNQNQTMTQAMAIRQKLQEEQAKLDKELRRKIHMQMRVSELMTSRKLFLRERGSSLAVTVSELTFLLNIQKEELEGAQSELARGIVRQRKHSLDLAKELGKLKKEESEASDEFRLQQQALLDGFSMMNSRTKILNSIKMRTAKAKEVSKNICRDNDKLSKDDHLMMSRLRNMRMKADDNMHQMKQLGKVREIRNAYRGSERIEMETKLLDLLRKVACLKGRNKRFEEAYEKLAQKHKLLVLLIKVQNKNKPEAYDDEKELREYALDTIDLPGIIGMWMYDLSIAKHGAKEFMMYCKARRAMMHTIHAALCEDTHILGQVLQKRRVELSNDADAADADTSKLSG